MQNTIGLFIGLALWLGALPAGASRDIVYSARYYLPPGSRGHSHFHLYRINPDGSGRRQITYGNWDDEMPLWSPDGKEILFIRNSQTGRPVLCLTGANGQQVVKLFESDWRWMSQISWSPDNRTVAAVRVDNEGSALYLIDVRTRKSQRNFGVTRYVWSPNGRNLCVTYKHAPARIIQVESGHAVSAKEYIHWPIWLDERSIIDISAESTDNQISLVMLNMDGKAVRRIPLRSPATLGPDKLWRRVNARLAPVPNTANAVLVLNDVSCSTYRPFDQFYIVHLNQSGCRLLAEGQFLVWSPNGKHFCTAPHRDLIPYDKRRRVWGAPLQIGSVKGGKLHNIVSGLVWVSGCDWRKPAAR